MRSFDGLLASSFGLAVVVAGVAVSACSGARSTELDSYGAPPASSTDPALTPEDPSDPANPGAPGNVPGNGPDGGAGGGCAFADAKDHDGDGLSFSQGDCDDCNAKARPGLLDLPGDGIDQDCSGKADDELTCDDGLALTSTSAYDAAKALGLCKKVPAQGPGWGVVEARWAKPDGTAIAASESWGLLPKLGSNLAPSGKAMLALSTGTARGPSDPGYKAPTGHDKGYTHGVPAGQPKPSSACPAADAPGPAHDGVALELKVRVPLDAKSLAFTHQLFTLDYGEYVCSEYNDVFVTMMEPAPAGTNGNVVFDGLGDGIGVNSASLLRACTPSVSNGITFGCPLGAGSLAGTGFDGKAATGWLRTTVPVVGGSVVTLRFAVWDSGDGIQDTTVLIDDLGFSTEAAPTTKTVPR